MAKTNVPVKGESVKTHEGGAAQRTKSLNELLRTISTCLLFEDTFYDGADSIANRLLKQAEAVSKSQLIDTIIHTKYKLNLRHAPLWLAARLTQLHKGHEVGDAIFMAISRADELAEFLSMYWKIAGKDAPVTKQAKLGLGKAFSKFDEYQFAKWNQDGEVKLRDAMFLAHPKPPAGKEALYKAIAENTLAVPDTWEVAITKCHTDEEKLAEWTRLVEQKRLGTLALIRNLRNMEKVGVDIGLICEAIDKANPRGILPHQLLSAWRNAPAFSKAIDSLVDRIMQADKGMLPGTTFLVVDVSGSMHGPVSNKSEVTRMDAASALAAHVIGACENVRVFSFSNEVIEVPVSPGFGIVTAIVNSQGHHNTYLAEAIETITPKTKGAERVIVITDEQAQGGGLKATLANRNYVMNVAPYKFGIETDKSWYKVNGFSNYLVRWIVDEETNSTWKEE